MSLARSPPVSAGALASRPSSGNSDDLLTGGGLGAGRASVAGSLLLSRSDATPPVAGHGISASDGAAVETVALNRLPAFWKANPDLWFIQIEAVFQLNRIRNDATRYDLLVAKLDSETIQEVADILRSPPPTDKYEALKKAILDRLTDSSDRQLLKLLTQLELGDRKPSQLLRHMKSLAGDTVSEDVIRVKWLDLLPPTVSRFLRVFKAPNLTELATAADELTDSNPSVSATSFSRASTPTSGIASPSSSTEVAQELAAIRVSLAQLIALTRENLERDTAQQSAPRRSRPRSRSASRTSARSLTPASQTNTRWCWYHRTFGDDSRKCQQPCSFTRSSGNA